MSEEKPKVRYLCLNSRRICCGSSSCCHVIPQMCTLQWPGLHVFSKSAQMNENPYIRTSNLMLLNYTESESGEERLVVYDGFEVATNGCCAIVIICGYFLCETEPRYIRNRNSDNRAPVKVAHLCKKTNPGVLLLSFFLIIYIVP